VEIRVWRLFYGSFGQGSTSKCVHAMVEPQIINRVPKVERGKMGLFQIVNPLGFRNTILIAIYIILFLIAFKIITFFSFIFR